MRLGIASGDWIHPSKTHDNKERWGGAGWVRLGQYMSHFPFDVYAGVLVWYKDHFVIQEVDGSQHDVDVIYMQRLMHEGLLDTIPRAQAIGQKIINDLDDWYWGLDPSNHAFKANHPTHNKGENTQFYGGILAKSDLVTVSTPYLADRIKSKVKGELLIVPNTVDVARFTPRNHVDVDVPLVGWVGSTAHRSRDLETVAGVIGPMQQRGEIRLHHSGDAPTHPSFASHIGLPDEAVTTLPLCDHHSYPSLMVMDIGIVPLRNAPFNRAKSAIKGLEYAAAGVPFVAQDLDAYVELNRAGIGRIARHPKNWISHIRALSSVEVRAEEASRNRELVKQFDISVGAIRLIDIINNL